MRQALWETSTGALVALLNSGAPLQYADLYTLTLTNGSVYRWSSERFPITGNGNTWTVGPGLYRGKVRWTLGTSVDDLDVTITDNSSTTIGGVGLMASIRAGGLLGATLQVDRCYWGVGQALPVGALFVFSGTVGEVKGGRHSVDIKVNSPLSLLDTQLPRELWQAGCLNTVFDSACTLQVATYSVTATATSATDAQRSNFSTNLTQADQYFSQGYAVGLTGLNAGIQRAVKTYLHAGGTLTVPQPWPFAVAIGDTFTVVPGCDGTQSTCTNKFANVIHFRGQPYIPTANTVM